MQINKEEELAVMVLHIDATCFITDRSITLLLFFFFITMHFFLTPEK